MVTKKKPGPLLKRRIEEISLPSIETRFSPVLRYSDKNTKVKEVKDKYVYLVSGLGNPKFFRKTVEHMGYKICGITEFKDHYNYKEDDILRLQTLAKESGASSVLTTEKDWLKIKKLSPQVVFGIVDIKMKVMDEDLLLDLIDF